MPIHLTCFFIEHGDPKIIPWEIGLNTAHGYATDYFSTNRTGDAFDNNCVYKKRSGMK